MIPWPTRPLGELVTETQYGTATRANEAGRGLPVLRMNNITTGGQLELSDLKWVELDERERERLVLEPGDILFNRTNSRELVGKTAVWDRREPFTFAGYLIRVRLRQDVLLPGFLSAYLNSPHGKTVLFHAAKPSINMANISATDLLRIEVPVPPLEHQKRVLPIFDKADAIRRKRKEAIALTEELLRSAFLEMFGDPVTNPKGWHVATLGDIASEMMYGTSEKCDAFESPTSIPVLRIPNVTGGVVLWDDLKYASLSETESRKLLLKNGDLLFVRSNGNPAYIGRCAVYDDARRALYASYLIRVRLLDHDRSLPSYVQAALSTNSYRTKLTAAAQTTAGNYNISTQGLRRLAVPLPPIQHQRDYAKFQAQIERLGRLNAISLKESETLFASLLHRAFRGELTAPTSKPASPATKQLSLLE